MTQHMRTECVCACTLFVPFVDIAIRGLFIIPSTEKKNGPNDIVYVELCVHTYNEKNTSMRIVERMNE